MMRVFRIFLINASYGFSGFAKEVTTRQSLWNCRRGMRDHPSLFSHRYLGRNSYQADYEKLKMTSKEKTVSQISHGWNNILWTLTLDCRLSSF